MKLTKSTNILISISVLVITLFLVSCDDDMEPQEDSETIDCEYCYDTMPQYVDMELIFNLTLNVETVRYTVFSGYAFTSAVYMVGESKVNSMWISVKPDQKYTVVAEYERGGYTIHVINDCFVKTEFFKLACENPCYYVYEASCDLTLKKHNFGRPSLE